MVRAVDVHVILTLWHSVGGSRLMWDRLLLIFIVIVYIVILIIATMIITIITITIIIVIITTIVIVLIAILTAYSIAFLGFVRRCRSWHNLPMGFLLQNPAPWRFDIAHVAPAFEVRRSYVFGGF